MRSLVLFVFLITGCSGFTTEAERLVFAIKSTEDQIAFVDEFISDSNNHHKKMGTEWTHAVLYAKLQKGLDDQLTYYKVRKKILAGESVFSVEMQGILDSE